MAFYKGVDSITRKKMTEVQSGKRSREETDILLLNFYRHCSVDLAGALVRVLKANRIRWRKLVYMHFIIMTLYDTHSFSAVILSTDPHKPLKGRATQSNTNPNDEL